MRNINNNDKCGFMKIKLSTQTTVTMLVSMNVSMNIICNKNEIRDQVLDDLY